MQKKKKKKKDTECVGAVVGEYAFMDKENNITI